MKATFTVLTNSFHNTEYATRKSREELDRILCKPREYRTPAEKAFVRKAWRHLCGIKDCVCCNEMGER